MDANQLVTGLCCLSQTGSTDSCFRHMGWLSAGFEKGRRRDATHGDGDVTAAHPGRCCCRRFRSCGSLRRSCSAAPGSLGHSEVSGWRPDRSRRSTRAVLRRQHQQLNKQHLMDQTNERNRDPNGVIPTCLGLVLAVRSAPPLGAGALVLVNPFYTGTSILAGIAGALAYVWWWRAEQSLPPSFACPSREIREATGKCITQYQYIWAV